MDCLPPIVCFQCGTDQNPCRCKVVGPTLGFFVTVGMVVCSRLLLSLLSLTTYKPKKKPSPRSSPASAPALGVYGHGYIRFRHSRKGTFAFQSGPGEGGGGAERGGVWFNNAVRRRARA